MGMDNLKSHLVNAGNALLKEFEHRPETRPLAEEFFRGLLRGCVGSSFPMASPPDYWKSVQIIGQQGLNILSWDHHRFPGARAVRLTDDPARMLTRNSQLGARTETEKAGLFANKKVQAVAGTTDKLFCEEKRPAFSVESRDPTGDFGLSAPGRDPSYLDRGTFAQDPADQEGHPGPYWRGLEGFGKVEKSLIPSLIDSGDFARDSLVLYTMVHGVLAVPEAIRTETEAGRISTFHDTAFLWDRVPGTRQAASTGAGHFQGDQLDLKQVVEGHGVQFNVSYDEEGAVRRIFAHRLKPNSWTMAFPGYVDYMINAGGLRFHDVSFRLSAEWSCLFEGGVKPKKLACAPYGLVADGSVLPVYEGVPPINWIKGPDPVMGDFPWKTLALLYQDLTESNSQDITERLSRYATQ